MDAVRSLTNHSTGRLGSTIAAELARRGAEVWMLAGETSVTPIQMYPNETFPALHVQPFRTVPELREMIRNALSTDHIDAVVMAAAVLDYLPVAALEEKKSTDAEEWVITLRRGEKLIEQLRKWSDRVVIVGFKLESHVTLETLSQQAWELMQRSDAALVVANRLEEIEASRHVAYLYERIDNSMGYNRSSPLNTREEIAAALADQLETRRRDAANRRNG